MRLVAMMVPVTLLLSACGKEAPEPAPEETEIPEELVKAPLQVAKHTNDSESVGTPREERVATLALLNKRNNLTQDIEMTPGESKRFGNVVIRLATCERTAPWEHPSETGAFVQVLVHERSADNSRAEWHRIFSGWLFKNSPSLNVVQHPIYDVWVKDCAMSFPGEEAPASSSSD
ncbi:DUF2155 domain-containing protein [Altericroceibacterium spongiae]|uniref:DUF2155 domain-containing protein n=1 Tax=Altericroceibacterium spongiae TaxID=2320269 RepID=A0A420EIY6_9SPHN|nr:DUF2155 domain-containing protein [Altericroceibacterium spongiae]RKF20627.1 DUF2155 domain-containing protein [Altericroceibacterium spongiae]